MPDPDLYNVIFDSMNDASGVLSELIDIVHGYDVATIWDLHNLVSAYGKSYSIKSVDRKYNNYGWVNLSNASISEVETGYQIVLPIPIYLDGGW